MSEEFWLKTSSNNAELSPTAMNRGQVNVFETNSKTPHEVFRNDTTAVEVIVKQVKNKNKKIGLLSSLPPEEINERLREDIENLKNDLFKANINLEETKKCFRQVMFEIVKQLEAANQRELKRQTKFIVQQLEKEKLKIILESKTNLVRKLRKELLNVKRIIKIVVKGIKLPFSTTVLSDTEYAEFESDLKTTLQKTSLDGDVFNYETTMSTNM